MTQVYTGEVEILHCYYSHEEISVKVEADDEQEALVKAKEQAREDCEPDKWDADHDNSAIQGCKVVSIDEKGEPEQERCNKTPDMFEGLTA